MLIQTIQIALTILGFMLLSGLAIFYVTSKVRKQDMELLRNTNNDLRSAIDDKGSEIAQLRIDVSKMQDEIAILKHANRTLEQLVATALDKYFVDNPQAALELAKIK